MRNIVAFDIETTGLDKTRDHIIQISMVKFNPETYEIIETYDSYVKPIGNYTISVPAYIKHKIRPEFLLDKPTLRDIGDDIIKFFEDCDVLTYNGVNFDIPFLNKELESVGKHIDFTNCHCYDSYVEECKRLPHNLNDTFKRYTGMSMDDSDYDRHNALSDVKATIEVFKAQSKEAAVDETKVYGYSGMVKNMIFEGKDIPCFSYGKYKTLPVKMVYKYDPSYITWAISSKSGIDNDTKHFLEEYLNI